MKSQLPQVLFDFLFSVCESDSFFTFEPYFISVANEDKFERLYSQFDPSERIGKIYCQTVESPGLAAYIDNVVMSNQELQSCFYLAYSLSHDEPDVLDSLTGFIPWIEKMDRHVTKHIALTSPAAYSIFPFDLFDLWNKVAALMKILSNGKKKEDYDFIENERNQAHHYVLKSLINVKLALPEYYKVIEILLTAPGGPHLKLVAPENNKVTPLDNADIKFAISVAHSYLKQAWSNLTYMAMPSHDKKKKNDLIDVREKIAIVHRAIEFTDYDCDSTVDVTHIEPIDITSIIEKFQ